MRRQYTTGSTYYSESERIEAKQTNQLMYYNLRHTWPVGIPLWLFDTTLKSIEVIPMLLSRYKIGRSAFGIVSLIFSHVLICFTGILDQSFILNVAQMEIEPVVYALRLASRAVVNPMILMGHNLTFMVLDGVVVFLGLFNKGLEFLLPVDQRPELKSRGESIVLSLFAKITSSPSSRIPFKKVAEKIRKSDLWFNGKGLYMTFIEPLGILGICYAIYFGVTQGYLSKDFLPLAYLIGLGTMLMVYRDLRAFGKLRKTI